MPSRDCNGKKRFSASSAKRFAFSFDILTIAGLFTTFFMASLVETLFKNQVHIGHTKDRWNPKIKSFLFGRRNNVHVFDLQKTAAALEEAQKFLAALKLRNGRVLFVGTKPQIAFVLKQKLTGGKHFFIDQKWAPGVLTNFTEIRKRIDHYLNLKQQFESGEINKYTKKEIAGFKADLEKLDTAYHGVAEMRKRPDAVVVLDAVGNRLSIEESNKIKVPVIALVDTNADPDGIAYPIPGNDDSVKSVGCILDQLLEALK